VSEVQFVEHHIPHSGQMIYARDYPGEGPAYVLLHGFPDNLHIYDYVVPLIARTGRRAVAFDFLGFGQSDKPAPSAFHYDFDQQVGDLTAVVDALKLDRFIPVGHDSGGPCAANYALDNRGRFNRGAFYPCNRETSANRALADGRRARAGCRPFVGRRLVSPVFDGLR
jgi:haloalkane dehalogenase